MTTRYFAEYQEECHYVGSSQRFLHTVKQQIPIPLDPVLSRPHSEEETSHIKAAETIFLKYLMGVSPHCPQSEIPYVRNIVGEEAEAVISRYRSVWKYQPKNTGTP